MHPLFAGFHGVDLYAVGRALGFIVHAEAGRGGLPNALTHEQVGRLSSGGDLEDYLYAGGWNAPAAHCQLFVKPLTHLAGELWRVGLEADKGVVKLSAMKPCPFCAGPPVAIVSSCPDGEAPELSTYGEDGLAVEATVFCHECGSQGPEVEDVIFDRADFQSIRERAIALWQARDMRHAPLYVASLCAVKPVSLACP